MNFISQVKKIAICGVASLGMLVSVGNIGLSAIYPLEDENLSAESDYSCDFESLSEEDKIKLINLAIKLLRKGQTWEFVSKFLGVSSDILILVVIESMNDIPPHTHRVPLSGRKHALSFFAN